MGTRLLASTGGYYEGHRVFPIVLYAQKRLCSLASRLLVGREARLQAFDAQYSEAQAKKRRRKVRPYRLRRWNTSFPARRTE